MPTQRPDAMIIGGYPFPEVLSGYAARNAAAVLADNWRIALHDGASLPRLLADVDATIAHLKAFKRLIPAADPQAL